MKKNILMIMYAKSVGGAELQFLELANYLAESNKVRLLCLGGDGAIKNAKVSDTLDIQVYSYDSFYSALLTLIKVILLYFRFPKDTIITTSHIGNLTGWLIRGFSTSKLVSLQTVSKCLRNPIVHHFVLKRFDILVAGANDIKEYLIAYKQNPEKIHVVHNWVDFSKRDVTKTALNMKQQLGIEGKLAVGCIGRFHPQKGQIYLIRAFADIVKKHPDVVLVLVGDGDTRELLEEEVKQLNISNSVIFTGTISGDEYNNLLNMFDIYVQPSLFEGLPRTLLDAMYMEKAIIATDINGNKEAVKHEENGLLVSSESSDEIYTALVRLLHGIDERKYFAKNAHETSCSKFEMNSQLSVIKNLSLDAK